MRIAVLGASGKTGRTVVDQALGRGHEVVGIVRDPVTFLAAHPALEGRVELHAADVMARSTFPDLSGVEVVISALGISKGDGPGALEAGARIVAALPSSTTRVLWLGALGSGVSTGAGGGLYQLVMRAFVGKELVEKAAADRIALAGGATVFHAPDVAKGPISDDRRMLRLADYPKPVLPPRVSRGTLAALLLDEAEQASYAAEVVVPLG